jgi:4-hydroxy-4-methyl-2-oxoglutarate aldolase
MIKDPPLLTIRRNFPRARPKELAAFAQVQTGYVVDAMEGRGALDPRIKPLAPMPSVLVGTALTCHCGPADNLALFAALATARAGDVLVAATDGFTGTSITGDLLMGMARNRGLLGLVTDGLARDLAGILGVGLPVYCAGLTPNSPARNGPGTVGLPVVMGGVAIESGDVIVADNDGVVIVPRRQVGDVIGRLPAYARRNQDSKPR